MPKARQPAISRYLSRDDSWLTFNQRVLEEAQDASNPLLERVKFLAITASNLDEFVEIRVAGFLQRIEDGYNLAQPPDEGGLTPQERLDGLMVRIHEFVEAQYKCLNEQLLPALQTARIRILRWGQLSDIARKHALDFYENEVDPLLTLGIPDRAQQQVDLRVAVLRIPMQMGAPPTMHPAAGEWRQSHSRTPTG